MPLTLRQTLDNYRARPWLSEKHYAELAKELGVEVCEVDAVLDARAAHQAWLAERIDYLGRDGL